MLQPLEFFLEEKKNDFNLMKKEKVERQGQYERQKKIEYIKKGEDTSV